jgi:hypothetical protein
MIVLSTKLQERMALNTGGTFLEFVSNVIIADHATKKRKVVAAPSGSAPPKYRIIRCTTTAPPTHLTSRSSINTSVRSNSALPAHLSAHTSSQHPRLYLRLCCAYLHHRPLEPPPATPTSTVVAQATSLEIAPRRRRMPLRATSLICHAVHRRRPLQRLVASTTPLWRTLQRVSKSSRVCFL